MQLWRTQVFQVKHAIKKNKTKLHNPKSMKNDHKNPQNIEQTNSWPKCLVIYRLSLFHLQFVKPERVCSLFSHLSSIRVFLRRDLQTSWSPPSHSSFLSPGLRWLPPSHTQHANTFPTVSDLLFSSLSHLLVNLTPTSSSASSRRPAAAPATCIASCYVGTMTTVMNSAWRSRIQADVGFVCGCSISNGAHVSRGWNLSRGLVYIESDHSLLIYSTFIHSMSAWVFVGLCVETRSGGKVSLSRIWFPRIQKSKSCH